MEESPADQDPKLDSWKDEEENEEEGEEETGSPTQHCTVYGDASPDQHWAETERYGGCNALAKYNDLKLKEWFTIQSELSALAKNQTEAKKINRLHKLMRNRQGRKTQEEIAKQLTNSEYDE